MLSFHVSDNVPGAANLVGRFEMSTETNTILEEVALAAPSMRRESKKKKSTAKEGRSYLSRKYIRQALPDLAPKFLNDTHIFRQWLLAYCLTRPHGPVGSP